VPWWTLLLLRMVVAHTTIVTYPRSRVQQQFPLIV
jgi:hypothetical protein